MFLLSPANLSGVRGELVLNPAAEFPLARELRSPAGAPLGQVFAFVSGLYFRGKLTYALAFGRPPPELSGALVISPCEGLRFAHEPVTIDRLRAWATVPVEHDNPRFTDPLVRHAEALERAHGSQTSFVLLGSVATDKYVRPLARVFGSRLLFPTDFAGLGDMSRGALLLRAAREGRELVYEPVAGARRHGSRPAAARRARASIAEEGDARPARRERPPTIPELPELVILIGLPGAGKTTFFRQQFGRSHVHVSKDNLRSQGKAGRQAELIAEALAAGRSVVVDNVHAAVEERAPVIAEARRHGARVAGYYFECTTRECVARNAGREGRARIPNVGIFAAAKRFARPSLAEGFDELYRVRALPEVRFDIRPE